MIHQNSEKWPVPVPEKYIISNTVYQTHILSTDGLAGHSRKEKIKILHNAIDDEPFGISYTLPIHHLYLFQIAQDGEFVYFERQTRNGWTDFIWHLSSQFHTPDGKLIIRLPTYYNVAEDLWSKHQEDPAKYEIVAQWIKDMQYNDRFPEWDEVVNISFEAGVNIGSLLMCINIAFLEQDNKNHGAQGRRMMYSLMPLTKEEMDATFDLVNGCFTARENLRFLYHSNMDLGYIVKELNKDFCHMKRTFIISETNSSITFKKEKIDFVITYGLNNNYLIMDNITIDKNGLHIMIKENNFNQEYLTNWFHSYFSDIGIKEGGDKYCFKWGKATLVDGFVDVCFNPKWDEKMLYKKVKQLKK